MRNKNNKLKLFKFLSIIYNPNKYPLNYNVVNKIANGMFNSNYSRKLLKNFLGSDYGYFVDIKDELFDLDNFVYRVISTIKYLRQDNDLLWGLCPSFNKQEVKQKFWNKLNSIITSDNKNNLLQISLNEINKLKDIKTIISMKRDIEEFKYLLAKDEFEMVKRLYDYPPYYLLKDSIRNYLNLWYEENKKNWIDTIKQFNNPIIQISLNHLYCKENYLLYIKQINNNDNKIIKSLFVMNCFNQIIRNGTEETISNKRIISKVVNKITEFDDNFFWFGILLSNSEYIFPRNKIWINNYIEKRVKRALVITLKKTVEPPKAILLYKDGLNQTPRNTALRHFNIFYYLKIDYPEIAQNLMLELINDYKIQIKKGELYLIDNLDIDYINSLTEAVSSLHQENKLDYHILFKELLEQFLLTEEDYKYRFSEMIKTKSTVLHIFLTLFGTIDILNKQTKIDVDEIKSYFDMFLKYINLFRYFDQDVHFVEKVFELNIIKNNDIVQQEIKHLYEEFAHPEFYALSILISKTKRNEYIKQIVQFMNDYFDKYYTQWLKNQNLLRKKHMFETWRQIFIRLEDVERKDICKRILDN